MEYELKTFDEDLLVIGPDMNADRYQEIKDALPTEIKQRLIGWRLVSRVMPGAGSVSTAFSQHYRARSSVRTNHKL